MKRSALSIETLSSVVLRQLQSEATCDSVCVLNSGVHSVDLLIWIPCGSMLLCSFFSFDIQIGE